MYKYIGLALLGVFAMMVIPAAQVDLGSTGPEFYGIGSMVLFNADGNEVFAQSIHNAVLNSGEDYIITQAFQQSGSPAVEADGVGISTICVTLEASFVATNEALTATAFDSADDVTENNCIEDSGISYSTGTGAVTIGPLTFAAGGTNLADSDTITGIGICQGHTVSPFANCLTANVGAGILFATIATATTQLLTDETVQISYTFNIA